MSYPVIIGIAGPARSGKDTVADFLIAETNGYKYNLADPMRAMLKAGFGIDLTLDYWADKKETSIPALGKSPRQLMQTLGTEWGRNLIGEDTWLVLAQAQLLRRGAGMIIPDIRFENEAAWVRSRGGTIIHVRRKNAPQVHAHTSESGIKAAPGEVTIYNDGSLQDLQNSVGEIVDGWKT
jgi:hypothetical protein